MSLMLMFYTVGCELCKGGWTESSETRSVSDVRCAGRWNVSATGDTDAKDVNMFQGLVWGCLKWD